MGILSIEKQVNNILIDYGFKYKHYSVTGNLHNCYEKTIQLSTLYYAWIAVKPDTNKVFIYIEFECGGEVASYDLSLTKSFENDPQGFFAELDELVTEYTYSYTI